MAAPPDALIEARTPEGIGYALRPAGPMARAVAAFIDLCVQGLAMIAVGSILGALSLLTGAWVLLLAYFLLTWFYHAAFELFWEGRSPGKRVLGLRVVMPDGSPVSVGASFVRNLLRFADGFLFLYHPALIAMALTTGFRRLGDMAAGTLVVYSDASAYGLRGRIVWPKDLAATPPPRALDYDEKRALLSFARRYALLGKGRADELSYSWAESLGWEAASGRSASEFLLGMARFVAGDAS